MVFIGFPAATPVSLGALEERPKEDHCQIFALWIKILNFLILLSRSEERPKEDHCQKFDLSIGMMSLLP